jgi:DNA polymerase III subunit delta
MKITSFQLEAHLRNRLDNIYLVCGDEPFMIQETFTLLRERAEKAGFNDRIRIDIDSDSDIELAYAHAYTPSLMGQRRLLEIYWKNKLSKPAQQFLVNYSLSPSRHALVIARLGKLDSKTEQTQWFKQVEKNSVILPLWPLQPKQLPAWISQRAKMQGLLIAPDAAQLLAEYTEGNLQAAAQEIEKLSLSGYDKIDRQIIDSFVSDQGCFNAFDLVDQALSGNSSQVLRILHYLQHEGSEPLMILGAYMHELRTITKIAKELDAGAALVNLFAQYRTRPTKQNAIREFLKRNKTKDCLNLILQASEIDYLAKGLTNGNIWEALQRFSLKVAGISLSRII